MGNRGILHNEQRVVIKKWVGKAWVACDPNFKGIDRRPLFQPHRYSELFFLDEATAFAAGHRPCAYCRREDFIHFKSMWHLAFGGDTNAHSLEITSVDAALHRDRISSSRSKRTYWASPSELPDGVLFAVDQHAFLVHRGSHLLWSHTGYTRAESIIVAGEVEVLTPKSIVQLFIAGYKPQVHASADS